MGRQVMSRLPQHGFVLFITLILMILMSIAGLAVMRSVDTSNSVTINIALRQSALAASESGVAAATRWLSSQSATQLFQHQTSQGYYAAVNARGVDVFGSSTISKLDDVNWTDRAAVATGAAQPSPLSTVDSSGHRVQFVIHRMCNRLGDPGAPDQDCATASGGASKGDSYGDSPQGQPNGAPAAATPFYRVTVRVIGAKNTEVFTQTVVSI